MRAAGPHRATGQSENWRFHLSVDLFRYRVDRGHVFGALRSLPFIPVHGPGIGSTARTALSFHVNVTPPSWPYSHGTRSAQLTEQSEPTEICVSPYCRINLSTVTTYELAFLPKLATINSRARRARQWRPDS